MGVVGLIVYTIAGNKVIVASLTRTKKHLGNA